MGFFNFVAFRPHVRFHVAIMRSFRQGDSLDGELLREDAASHCIGQEEQGSI